MTHIINLDASVHRNLFWFGYNFIIILHSDIVGVRSNVCFELRLVTLAATVNGHDGDFLFCLRLA